MGLREWPSNQEHLLCNREDLSSNPRGPCKKLGMTRGVCDPGTVGWRQLDPGSSLPSKPRPNSKFLVQEENLSQGNQDPGREKHSESTPAYSCSCNTPTPPMHQSIM